MSQVAALCSLKASPCFVQINQQKNSTVFPNHCAPNRFRASAGPDKAGERLKGREIYRDNLFRLVYHNAVGHCFILHLEDPRGLVAYRITKGNDLMKAMRLPALTFNIFGMRHPGYLGGINCHSDTTHGKHEENKLILADRTAARFHQSASFPKIFPVSRMVTFLPLNINSPVTHSFLKASSVERGGLMLLTGTSSTSSMESTIMPDRMPPLTAIAILLREVLLLSG